MLVKRYSKNNVKAYNETYKYSNAYMFLLAHKHKNLYNLKNNNSFDCIYNSDYYTKDYELLFNQKLKNHLKLHNFYFPRFKNLNAYMSIKDFADFCYKAQFVYIDLNDDFCMFYNNKTYVFKLKSYDTNDFKIKALHIKSNSIKEFSLFDLYLHESQTTLRFFPNLSKIEHIYFPFYFLDYGYLRKAYEAFKEHCF